MFQAALQPAEVIAVIAGLLRGLGPGTSAIGGTIGFRVQGPDGGDWLVDLGQPGGAWSQPEDPELVERSTVAVYAYPGTFAELVLAPEGIEASLKSGYLDVDGDRGRLVLLSKMLGARGSMIEQRSRSSQTKKATSRRRNRS